MAIVLDGKSVMSVMHGETEYLACEFALSLRDEVDNSKVINSIFSIDGDEGYFVGITCYGRITALVDSADLSDITLEITATPIGNEEGAISVEVEIGDLIEEEVGDTITGSIQ